MGTLMKTRNWDYRPQYADCAISIRDRVPDVCSMIAVLGISSILSSLKSISGSVFELESGNENVDRRAHDQMDGCVHNQMDGQTPIS